MDSSAHTATVDLEISNVTCVAANSEICSVTCVAANS